MSLPIDRILWAGNDSNHHDHLHVEGTPRFLGTITGAGTQPPPNNPGLTESTQTIFDALENKFGPVEYMNPATAGWSTMGWYNRRPIRGSTQWSQHAWANAIDIGPYNGVREQQRFYDYLTGEDPDMAEKLPLEDWAIPAFTWATANGVYTEQTDLSKIREPYEFQQLMVALWRVGSERKGHFPTGGSGVDQTARNRANRANKRLDDIIIPD